MLEEIKDRHIKWIRHKEATLQSNHALAQLKTIDGHSSMNVWKSCQLMIEDTSSPSFQSSPNSTDNPSCMSNETLGLSSRPATPPLVPTFVCPMTKFEMLQSQSKTLATIISNFKAIVGDQEALSRQKVDVSIRKKCFWDKELKGNLKMWCHYGWRV